MKPNNSLKTLQILIPAVLMMVLFSALIGSAVASGQSSTKFGGSIPTDEPTNAELITASPFPKESSISNSTEPPLNEESGAGGNEFNRKSGSYIPPGPNWTEAQRACQALMEQISAESNRIGAASNAVSQAYTSLLNELQAKYGSNPWSAEDTARYEQARAETERASAESYAFWSQYPWQQWGCNENGLWHVP